MGPIDESTPIEEAAIDWNAALTRFHALGLELEGNVPEDDARPNDALAWSCAHLALHPLRVERCKGCAVSLVVQEIALHRGQGSAAKPLLSFAAELERSYEPFHAAFMAIATKFPAVLAYSQRLHAPPDDPRCGSMPHAHDEICNAPREVMRSMLVTLRLVEDTAAGIRTRFTTVGHQLPGSPKWLLIAIAQHLKHGGFSHRENAALAPDQPTSRLPNDKDIDRVRKRFCAEEARSFIAAPAPQRSGEESTPAS